MDVVLPVQDALVVILLDYFEALICAISSSHSEFEQLVLGGRVATVSDEVD